MPADGLDLVWETWDGGDTETCRVNWDNEAWTIEGRVGREQIHYVVRAAPTWRVRQFLLWRDLDDPDLWLATDGHARWGEMNGAHRTELDGCLDLVFDVTPLTHTLPIRRLPLAVGDAAVIPVVSVDVETLAVVPVRRRYERTAEQTWTVTDHDDGTTARTLTVDALGFVIAEDGRFRRRGAR